MIIVSAVSTSSAHINILYNSGSCVDLGQQRIRKAVEDSSSNREACLKARETLKASKRGKVIENDHEGQEKISASEVVLC